MQVLGQGNDVARFKSSLPKAYYSWSYFQVFPLSLLGSLSQTKCSYPIFQFFSFHSFSHVLVIHQSCIASVMNRVSISAEHRQFELIQVPVGDSLSHAYVELNLAYINLATESSHTKPSPRHPRAQHTSNPATFKPRGYTLLPPSLHS